MKKIILLIFVVISLDVVAQFHKDTSVGLLSKFITNWIGKPYKYGGKTEKGIDCSQFNKRLYKDVYGQELDNTCAKQWTQTTRVQKDSLEIGDLLFFRSTISPSGWHCGVYIGNNQFVHSANKKEGVKISSLSELRYRRAYKGAGRL